jgi:HEAT repeat protein
MEFLNTPDIEKMKAERDVEGLINALNYQKDPKVRWAAVVELGEIKDTRAVEPLIAAIKDNELAWRAAQALGKIGDVRAVESLIAALKDTQRAVCQKAAEALVKIGVPATEQLIGAIKNEDELVRNAAALALSKIGIPTVDPLISMLKDNSAGVRRTAAYALGWMGDTRAVRPLVDALKDEDQYVRSSAAYALGGLRDTEAVEPLIAALKDDYSSVRKAVAHVLGLIGDSRAVEPLLPVLWDEDLQVQPEVIFALEKIGDPRAVTSLIRVFDSAVKPEPKMLAARALGKIGDASAVVPLINLLKRFEFEAVRCEIIGALGMIGDARAVEPLVNSLTFPDKSVRNAAAIALVKLGKPEIEPLKRTLKAPERDRYWAAEALGDLKDDRAVELLIAMLSDEECFMRKEAADALEKIGWKPGNDETGAAYWIGKQNWEECIKIGAPAFKPLLVALGEYRDKEVHRNAIKALNTLYRAGLLDETNKKLILAHPKSLIEPHEDVPENNIREHTDNATVEFTL